MLSFPPLPGDSRSSKVITPSKTKRTDDTREYAERINRTGGVDGNDTTDPGWNEISHDGDVV